MMEEKRRPDKRRAHGMEFQRWIKVWLEQRGWTVHNQPMKPTRIMVKGKILWISRSQDIFGCVDLIARRKGESRTLWIQATLDTSIGRKIAELGVVPWGSSDCVQVWVKRAGGRVDIFAADPGMSEAIMVGSITRRVYTVSPKYGAVSLILTNNII